jgi:hypothetical protein
VLEEAKATVAVTREPDLAGELDETVACVEVGE